MTAVSNKRDKLRARMRERERRLLAAERRDAKAGQKPRPHPDDGLTDNQRRRRAATTCGWCGGPIEPKARGRIPKWCSATCRQRAWEQSRAAASGRSAVDVVERVVEIPIRPIPGVAVARHPQHQEWLPLLDELAKQLQAGGLVYERDLCSIARAIDQVNDALAARLASRG
jgi:hypothetical protein